MMAGDTNAGDMMAGLGRVTGMAALAALLLLTGCGGAAPAPDAPATDAPVADAPAPGAPVADAPVAAMPAPDARVGEVKDIAMLEEYSTLKGDAAAGKLVFAQCAACHSLEEGVNRVGPSLHGIVGRESGTVPGFRYSSANLASDMVWTEGALFSYLKKPRETIPGTTMAFGGIADAQKRADLIAYLKTGGQ